jgi:uncharacterized membrane protein YraQ (UPF0718 family)
LLKSGRVLWELAPYVVLGVLASRALRYTALSRAVERACASVPTVAVLGAAGLGMLSPLCTYGTVPVVLQLFRAGVPLAPLATFLSTSSLMNPQLFILTWGGIGPALARAGSVLLFGVALGMLVQRIPLRLITTAAAGAGAGGSEQPETDRPRPHPERKWFELWTFLRDSYEMTLFVGCYLVIGLIVGAALAVFVPAAWIVRMFRPGEWAAVALAAVLGDAVYQSGRRADVFCRRPDGKPFVGPVWAGPSCFPDFVRADVRTWWKRQLEFLLARGVAGVWNDMNEPSIFGQQRSLPPQACGLPPTAAQPFVQTTPEGEVGHLEVRNVYGLAMARAASEAQLEHHPGRRPFVLTRFCYAGMQRYGAVWLGDNKSWFEHLRLSIPMLLNLGLSGIPFCGVDIGGFGEHCDAELLVRW